jgi:hypothetical protein
MSCNNFVGLDIFPLLLISVKRYNLWLQWDADHDYDGDSNNKGSWCVGEVAPLCGVDPAVFLTNPGVQ